MFLRYLARLVVVFLLLLPLTGRSVTYPVSGYSVDPASGIEIEVFSFYENPPPSGTSPEQITITNNTQKEGSWTFYFTSEASWSDKSSIHSTFRITVGPKETKRTDILVPLTPTNYVLQGNVEGPGIIRGGFTRHTNYYSGSSVSSAIGMSDSLAPRNFQLISDATSSGKMAGSPFDLSRMPTNWRGFAGMDQIWITDEDWLKIGTAERTALLEWTALGRTLYISREPSQNTALPLISGFLSASDPSIPVGLGFIKGWSRNGDELDASAVAAEIDTTGGKVRQEMLSQGYATYPWKPLSDLSPFQLRPDLLISFLVIFGILIGPVNLFYFARGTRRYRLFWTTPLISVGASGLIFLLILIQDGTGGHGYQQALWYHFPEQNKAVFLQEQASRNALLLHRRFETKHPAIFSRIATRLGNTTAANLSVDGQWMEGDYFRNRSIDAWLIEAVTATRWRVEQLPGAAGEPPQLLSTFSFPLRAIYFVDAKQNAWFAENLQPGSAHTLKSVSPAELKAALNEFRLNSGPEIKAGLHTLAQDKPGQFFAFTENAPGATEQTLDSIDWQSQTLHTGPVVVSQP